MKLTHSTHLQISKEEKEALIKEVRQLVLAHLKKIILNDALERHRDRISYYGGLMVEELHGDIASEFPLPEEQEKK